MSNITEIKNSFGTNDQKNILSICIPTYNRANYLDQCLSVLVPQASELGIPIYICDNASTDITPSIIKKYQSIYHGVSAIRQVYNVGFDLNHKAVVNMVTTEFAWLLGDDDVLMIGALKKVFKYLNKNPSCELLLLNAKLTDNDLKPRGLHFNIDNDLKIKDCNLLLKSFSDKLTFGMMIINAQLFNETNADRFIGTAHLYAGGTYDYLAECYLKNNTNNIRILSEPYVLLRQGDRQWTQNTGDIAVRQIPEFYFRMHPHFNENAQIGLNRATGSYRTLLPLIRLRAENWLDIHRTREMKNYYLGKNRYRLLVISKIPIFIAKGIALVGILTAKNLKKIKHIYYIHIAS